MNKQSSIEWLWHNLTDDLIGDLPNEKIHEIYNLVLQAKQMHKEEIAEAYCKGAFDMAHNDEIFPREKAEEYYQKTYGGNNESNT